MRLLVLAMLLVTALPLSGRAAPDGPPISDRKLNHYVSGFNFLVGTFGLQQQYRLYEAQHVAQKGPDAGVSISDGWIEQGLDELKQGGAIDGGGLPAVDAAAGMMIPILERLVERLHGLSAYYATRGQLEDNMARGHREDPLVLADFKAALAALEPLSDTLDAAIDRRDTADLYALEQSGDRIGFHGGMAMHEAKQLVGLMARPDALRDAKTTARADTLADAIVQSVADETQALDAAKASGDMDHALRNSNYRTAAGRLQNLVGLYRQMRHTGNAALRPMLDAAYNSAVESVNVGR